MARDDDEPVRLTRIYTRGGDAGETSLGDGSRVSKLDARIGAYGATDELNAALGVALAHGVDDELRLVLERVQNELFDVGADLCVPVEVGGRLRVTQAMVDALEHDCDALNASLAELRSFVLPGGSIPAAHLHVARTVCRRAERQIIRLAREEAVGEHVVPYVNRLSDLLFVLSRWIGKQNGEREYLWERGLRNQARPAAARRKPAAPAGTQTRRKSR